MDYGFLYSLCDVYRPSIRYWLTIPEFREGIDKLVKAKGFVTKEDVLSVMEPIYEERYKHLRTWKYPEFQLGMAKAALKKLRKSVEADNQSKESNPEVISE